MSAPVSVLLPVYNGAGTLAECLESIRHQTFEDYQLLVVDDGSEDATVKILREFSIRDDRIEVLSPGRIGLVAALNLGLEACRGRYVARMDADDRMAPTRLARQYELLETNPDLALAGTRVEHAGPMAPRAGYREYLRWQNRLVDPEAITAELFVECPIAHPSMMFRRETVCSAGGYREGPFPEDYELVLRLWRSGARFGKVPETLLAWSDRPDRTSRTDGRYSRAAFDRLRSRFLAVDPRVRSAGSLVIWGAGRSRTRTRLLVEQGIDFQAWIDIDPRKVGRRLWDRPIHPPDWLLANRADLVLVYVSTHGAREEIGAFLDGAGYVNGQSYLLVG